MNLYLLKNNNVSNLEFIKIMMLSLSLFLIKLKILVK